MAAGGEMASCGYDEADVPNAPPIAPAAAIAGRDGGGEGQPGEHRGREGEHHPGGPDRAERPHDQHDDGASVQWHDHEQSVTRGRRSRQGQLLGAVGVPVHSIEPYTG